MTRQHADAHWPGRRLDAVDRARRRLLAVVLVVIATVTSPMAVVANATECPGVVSRGQWSTIAKPAWSTAPADAKHRELGNLAGARFVARSLAVDPVSPRRLFATDGYELMRSLDGGCSWRRVFSLYAADAPTDASSDTFPWLKRGYFIKSVVVATKGVVYLTLSAGFGDVGVQVSTAPLFVAASNNGGETWLTRQVMTGNSPENRVTSTAFASNLRIFAAPSDPATVYAIATWYGALFEYEQTDSYKVLVSRDGAKTWTFVREGPLGSVSDPSYSAVVDARQPNTIWSTGSYGYGFGKVKSFGVYRATDSGKSFGPVLTGKPPGAHGFDPSFLTTSTDGSRTCVLARSTVAAYISTDGGGQWTTLPPLPGQGRQAGRAALEGAGCMGGGRALVLAGYQPRSAPQPPFRRSSLFIYSPGRPWQRIADVPAALGHGSMSIAGPAGRPTVFWVGDDNNYGSVWLRYTGFTH